MLKLLVFFTLVVAAASSKFSKKNVLEELIKELLKDEILNETPSFCDGKADGDYRNPDNCNGYITCATGKSYERPCPNNLQWNDVKKRCDWARNVRCKQSSEDVCLMDGKTYKVGQTWVYGDCHLKCSCPPKQKRDRFGNPSCDLVCPRSVHPCGLHGIKGVKQVPSDVKGCTCPSYICNDKYEV